MAERAITLFLDFDGVLNNDAFQNNQRTQQPFCEHKLFDSSNIQALNHLCSVLPIEKIVVTSTLRKGRTIDEIRSFLSVEGFTYAAKVKDVTPVRRSLFEGRESEIRDWIAQHNPARILILDDMDLSSLEDGFFHVNSAEGLTMKLVETISQKMR